ncbi:glycosyltransferase family A protein [Salinimicrobium sp. MT39]|uniref:Glycosyltransferase family A protein n=1 Tax=Salinimicrobium profundisediminis TaxID=2994553 RepID=A0A9X3CVW7_9FLAO|nr:glycosyltransferase family A protein [Salinimicrobium profundisediminis]MCX2837498.1 glycosyltransferase family A protein [Salinimicrobium profundisediminis]
MKILVHKRALVPVKGISSNGEEISLKSENCTAALWELAGRFPNELIGWCEESYLKHLDLNQWKEIFYHHLIMASYAVETTFLPESIGYVEQLPFATLNRNVLFATWRMSRDVGGIHAKVLNRFKPLMSEIKDLEYLLNSVAKLGQQNSLFCYSAPSLLQKQPAENISYTASKQQLFTFVYQHYNSIWLLIIIWCFYKYEKDLSLRSLLKGFKTNKYFQNKVDLSGLEISTGRISEVSDAIDVIIPTMGRPEHLFNVLKDFSKQTRLPQKIIIVEQNSDRSSVSGLGYLETEEWPFEIIHHFIHQTGACNARNIALKEIKSEWVLFADDDIRLMHDTLENAFFEINRYKIDALSMNCVQEGEKTVFNKIKQWGSFGSGTSIVKSSFAKNCFFSPVYEHGYGEDLDFGMQLRNLGCDIVYHPGITIHHLKAPIGGFRDKPIMEWEKGNPKPKPSPTLMAYVLKYYSKEQIAGFKTSLLLKYYNKQSVRNPFKYNREMRESWKKSKTWAKKLLLLEINLKERTV